MQKFPMMASLTVISNRAGALANAKDLLAAAAVQFTALIIVHRAKTLLPAESDSFSLSYLPDLNFFYGGSQVQEALNAVGPLGRSFLTFSTLVNYIAIGTTAVILSILVTAGMTAVRSFNPPPIVNNYNLLPFASAVLRLVENTLFLFAIFGTGTAGSGWATAAGVFGAFRNLMDFFIYGFILLTFPIGFVQWAVSIGRDGRQRVKRADKIN
ncbi:hypothetical protein HK104_001207 [Borealophlyctis nickersoniae]|nr:hypothetical protein HK104_001207 [Borealophlyctis nickersoniae]